MEIGALTGHLDVAQLVLYAFWIFFFGLIFYIRREDRREGYPLENDITGKPEDAGLIWIPAPKTFHLPHGGEVQAPREEHDDREIKGEPAAGFPGAPMQPTGNPMVDGIGPAAWALREDKPDFDAEGHPKILPMRLAEGFSVVDQDANPVGMKVVACDGEEAGEIVELWIDRAESLVRYLEVARSGAVGNVLLPMPLAVVRGGPREVWVASITAAQFKDVPMHKSRDQVTKLEEDQISAYYGGGHMYATPQRLGPIL